ncbi:MAG: hypothetical protein LBS16_05350 [Prevotellaceae bacterium]|jgi:nitrite reductase/ring-hydroxylating ferredoxin subunit|nr:hypothetical protein [Prevotellaceae bacterium]
MNNKLFFIEICIVIMLLGTGCNGVGKHPIPDVPVYLDINITRDAPELNALGGYKEFIEPTNINQALGYGGIIIIRTFEDAMCAFDLSCPHEASPTVRLIPDNVGQARCSVCQTVFNIGYGTGFAVSGIARFPLKQYAVNWSYSTGNITVYN